MIWGGLEIDRDALLLPVAVTRGIEPRLFARGRLRTFDGFGLRYRRRWTEMSRGVQMLRAFHDAKMIMRRGNAKR